MKTNKNYILRTGLALTSSKRFPKNLELSQFELDGTEKEIFYKIMRNTAAVFAAHYSNINNTDINIEIKKLIKKYNIKNK
jgi:hypothetical protein